MSLLSMLAVGVLEGTRRHGQLVRRSIETFQAQELADSAIRLAVLELSAPPVANSNHGATASRTRKLFGRDVVVTFDYDAGRIDLNAADEHLLIAAFAGNGFSENQARELAQGIIDWRDVDDEMQPHGTERQDYRRAGRANGPRNGPFETISELRQILGAENIGDELLDAFTVYSHSATVKQTAAPPVVMNALRWANTQHLAGRTWLSADDSSSAASSDSISLAGKVVRLRACATTGQVETCRVAIVRFTGNRERPALVFAWHMHRESI